LISLILKSYEKYELWNFSLLKEVSISVKENPKLRHKIITIIPAFNEEASIGSVIKDIDKKLVDEIVVVNNASTDNSFKVAKDAGATVINEMQKGYGKACLTGIAYALTKNPDSIVFLDADYSDYPEEIKDVIQPILTEDIDMVIGSRVLGQKEKGAMLPQQIFGNWLATKLIRLFYGVTYTDLGPFRAIKTDKLLALEMKDETFGWTVEMQVKASKKKYKVQEVPVKYRKRIGVSKITGTIKGTILAGYKILFTIFRYL